jgi:hypothetical protein
VAVTGSLLDGLGQWLDVQLQPLACHFKSYIRDSADLVTWWSLLRNLPPLTRIFTMDAVSMYSNIDPTHCLDSLRAYLTNSPVSRELGLYYQRHAILHAIEILFKYNIFKFGDILVQQTEGIPMGSRPSPPLATIYYGIREEAVYAIMLALLMMVLVCGILLLAQTQLLPGLGSKQLSTLLGDR